MKMLYVPQDRVECWVQVARPPVSHVVSGSLSDRGGGAPGAKASELSSPEAHTWGLFGVHWPLRAFQWLPMDLAFITSGQHRVQHFFYIPIHLGPAQGFMDAHTP